MAITRSEVRGLPAGTGLRRLLVGLPLFGLELLFFLLFFGLYYVARGFRADLSGPGTANAERVIDFERALGIFREPGWHAWATERGTLLDLANVTYSMLHLPLIFAVGAVFFFVDMRKYRVLRNALLLSGLVALPVYHLFPLTPPRLLELNGVDLGFVDTVGHLRGSKAGYLTNNYAAMPSYHFGWILLVTYGVFWYFRSAWARALAVTFAAWMWCCIVFTANHYFVDMLAGAALVTLAFLAALHWERFLESRPGVERRWCYARTFRCGRFRIPF